MILWFTFGLEVIPDSMAEKVEGFTSKKLALLGRKLGGMSRLPELHAPSQGLGRRGL